MRNFTMLINTNIPGKKDRQFKKIHNTLDGRQVYISQKLIHFS